MFAIAGAVLALLLYAIARYSGMTLIAYWSKQLVAMFAPLTPLLLVPDTNSFLWLSVVVIANVILYGVVGFVLSRSATTALVYYCVLTFILAGMLLMTDEWRLYRWLATDDETMHGRSLLDVLGALHWQYFVTAAVMTVIALILLRPRLSRISEGREDTSRSF
jgi:hypothetical protein